MSPKDRNLIVGGVIICIIIAFLAPFIASSNPDGLEKSAEGLAPNMDTQPVFQSPLSNYSIPFLGEDNPYGGIIALVIGILITLFIAYIAAWIIKRQKMQKSLK